jgi:tetratricopeptide (TPR) repeat protein
MVGVATLSMTLYFVFVRPYKEENQQTTTVVDEIILFVVILFFMYIYMKQDEMPIEEKKNLGWIVIFIMIFSILKNLFVLLYFGFINMRKKMKAMFSAEDEALDSPHTSDDNSDTIDSIPTEEVEEVIFELRHNNEVSVTDEFPLTEIEGLELVDTEFTFSGQHQQIEEITDTDNNTELQTELVPKNEFQEKVELEQKEMSTMAEELAEEIVVDIEVSDKRDDLADEEIVESKEIQIEETDEKIQETEIQIEFSDIQEEEPIEAVIDSQKELEKFLDLRKNPIYNLEVELNSKQKERENATSEKDFFAWLKQPKGASEIVEKPIEEGLETIDKVEEEIEEDDIIARFIKKNPQISRPKKEFYNAENMAKKSEVFELDFVTETLAQLYHQQGDISLAIKVYEKLILQNPSKKAYFATLIENLKKENK